MAKTNSKPISESSEFPLNQPFILMYIASKEVLKSNIYQEKRSNLPVESNIRKSRQDRCNDV